jgi:hypothetical protein
MIQYPKTLTKFLFGLMISLARCQYVRGQGKGNPGKAAGFFFLYRPSPDVLYSTQVNGICLLLGTFMPWIRSGSSGL